MKFSDVAKEHSNLADSKSKLTPDACLKAFSHMSDENIKLLGLDPKHAKPAWLIVTVLPVAPPHVRPSVAVGGGLQRSEDDITHKLADIIKANTALANAKKSGQVRQVLQTFEEYLQYHVATLIDNQIIGVAAAKQRSGKALKTFRERLVGKGGRVRGNLMGKRVDFSARTVITADPILSMHQVGVPKTIASNLTVPERVNRYNMRKLEALVARGPKQHPGAKFIIRENGERFDLNVAKGNQTVLKPGYIVERHLMDDDTVLFNRQPTLHKMSIMCHKTKILDYSTFRMNLTCTTPYNADFDGDEMNLHALQTIPAIAEAQELMIVPRLIVTQGSNRPVMGIVQDSLLGSRLFTKRDVFLTKDVVMNEVLWMTPWNGRIPLPAVMKPVKGKPGKHFPLWTGKQMFSMIIPDINYSKDSQGAPSGEGLSNLWPSDTTVEVRRGELLMGLLDKAALGNKSGSMLHIIMNDLTPEDCRDFINNTQRVVNYWLLHRGFSIGIADAEAPSATIRNVATQISTAKEKVAAFLSEAQTGELVKHRQPGQTIMQTFESMVNTTLNNARDSASKAVLNVLDEGNNAVVAMVQAGSKGNNTNISNIIACVAQQNVEGKRIPYYWRSRTLPHFAKFDLGPEARGFVENSYLKGLTPTEFFFHMMGGRMGLIDTGKSGPYLCLPLNKQSRYFPRYLQP
jgi:DNA-directed RNA polymerase II subunit RPB1